MSVATLHDATALDRAELRRRLAAALAGLRPEETGLLALALPAGDPAAALSLRSADAFLWRAAGETWVGLDSALRLRGSGAGRCGELRAAAERAATSLRWCELTPGARALAGGRARWYGGLAFASGSADQPPWADFGDAELVLPRWLVGGDGLVNAGVLAVRGGDALAQGDALLERTLEEVDAFAAALQAAEGSSAGGAVLGGGTIADDRVDGGELEEEPGAGALRQRYRHSVERALVAIAAGRSRKLVPARRVEVELPAPIDLGSLVRRLGGSAAPATSAIFAFVRGERAFVGATPERLVRLRGRLVETHALAGSERARREHREDAEIEPAAAARRLLGRAKDRREHAWVVRHLVERLRPLCSRLDRAVEPHVLELPHVLHLETAVSGELRERRHVLELVERLHPTPAVAGYPVAAAVRWLAEHEAVPRGWYAGPVGWCDEAGDGDFRVALRAMLVTPRRALLYAGAGVVEGSDADAELRETDLKLEPARSALLETPDLSPAELDARISLPV